MLNSGSSSSSSNNNKDVCLENRSKNEIKITQHSSPSKSSFVAKYRQIFDQPQSQSPATQSQSQTSSSHSTQPQPPQIRESRQVPVKLSAINNDHHGGEASVNKEEPPSLSIAQRKQLYLKKSSETTNCSKEVVASAILPKRLQIPNNLNPLHPHPSSPTTPSSVPPINLPKTTTTTTTTTTTLNNRAKSPCQGEIENNQVRLRVKQDLQIRRPLSMHVTPTSVLLDSELNAIMMNNNKQDKPEMRDSLVRLRVHHSQIMFERDMKTTAESGVSFDDPVDQSRLLHSPLMDRVQMSKPQRRPRSILLTEEKSGDSQPIHEDNNVK